MLYYPSSKMKAPTLLTAVGRMSDMIRMCAMPNYKAPRPAIQLSDGSYEIELTKGYKTRIDAIDLDLNNVCWTVHENGSNRKTARRRPVINGKKQWQYLHRVIAMRMFGVDACSNMEVDHIDGNSLDNRRCNLRLATRMQNAQNKKRTAKCLKGVSYRPHRRGTKKYWAQISHKGKKFHLGQYLTEQEAHEAYCRKAVELFGEFARFN